MHPRTSHPRTRLRRYAATARQALAPSHPRTPVPSPFAPALAALLAVSLCAACSLVIKDPLAAFASTDVASADTLSREEALEDLDYLAGLIDRVHADPYRLHPRDLFEAERRRVAETMPASITRRDLCRRLSSVLAVLDDGHTELSCDDLVLNDWRRAARAASSETQRVLRFAPFVRLDEEQHPTVSWHNGAPGLDPGDRILRINGQDADALLAAWAAEISHDTDAGRRAAVARRFRVYMALHGIDAPYRLTVAPPGGPSREVTVPGDPVNHQFENTPVAPVRPPVTEANLPPVPATIFKPIQLKNGFFEYRMIEPDIAYMNFFSIFDGLDTVSHFEKAVEQLFPLIASDRPRVLIIDIRENSGGEDSVAEELLLHLTEKPFRVLTSIQLKRSKETRDFISSMIRVPFRWMGLHYLESEVRPYFTGEVGTLSPAREWPLQKRPRAEPFFEGPVCVLIGPHTYSAAVEFAEAVKTFELATLVGEDTGGRPNSFGNNFPFQLPRSRLVANIATASAVGANGLVTDVDPVQPDIVVRTTAADMRRGFDPVLERAKSCPPRAIR